MIETMRRSRDSSAVLAVMVAVALGVTAVGVLLAFRSAETHPRGGALLPASPPPPTGAFARGGVPDSGSPAVRAVFSDALPGFVIAADQWAKRGAPADDAELTTARDLVISAARALAEPGGSLPPATATALADAFSVLLDRVQAAAAAPEPVLDRAADALGVAAIELNDQLAAAGLGYAIDPDVISSGRRRVALVFAFTVGRVQLYRSGETIVRVLHIDRLDTLNWSYNLLGFTTPRRREALVLVTRVEERVVTDVLPLLAGDPPPLFALSEDDRVASWYPRFTERAVEVARDEYGGAGEPEQMRRLGELLARRKALFARWNELLARREMSVSAPERLAIEWDYARELAGLVPDDDLAELARLQDQLSDFRTQRAFVAARDLMLRSVERHEVQHRLDHGRAEPLPMPAELAEFVGPPRDPGGHDRPAATRAQAELSAYLAEIARDQRTPRVGLSFLTQFLIMPEHWGSAECYAAVVIYQGLARHMKLPVPPDVVAGHEVNRERVVAIYERLVVARPGDLRAAASALYAELFGGPLPPLAAVD